MQRSTRKWLLALLAAGFVALAVYQGRRFFGTGEFKGAKLLAAVRGADPFLLG